MSDLEALYRALLANPGEDTPRLAYADCVQESGDEARAELIRASCEASRLGVAEHVFYRQRARVNELLKANRERWEPACVTCGGTKTHEHTIGSKYTDEKCPACKGTGRQPCRWERGFPVVQVADMRQVWQGIGPPISPWQPTPWLRDLLRTHHVAGVVPGGVSPRTVAGEYYWHIQDVPNPLWKRGFCMFPTPELATTTLGRAVVLAALEWLDAQGVK